MLNYAFRQLNSNKKRILPHLKDMSSLKNIELLSVVSDFSESWLKPNYQKSVGNSRHFALQDILGLGI